MTNVAMFVATSKKNMRTEIIVMRSYLSISSSFLLKTRARPQMKEVR